MSGHDSPSKRKCSCAECREHRNEIARRWRRAHPEKVRESKRRWAKDNPEKQRERRRRWREANPDKHREESRKYNEASKHSSVVYLVGREGLVKIGITVNLRKRLQSLNRGDSSAPGMTVGPVELLATTPGDRVKERELHGRFAAYRIPGTEWFRDNPELRALIAELSDDD